jgi:hypothetical protein
VNGTIEKTITSPSGWTSQQKIDRLVLWSVDFTSLVDANLTNLVDLRIFGTVSSKNIQKADGTSGQDVTVGSGVKTDHIQDSAITPVKVDSTGAYTVSSIEATDIEATGTAKIASWFAQSLGENGYARIGGLLLQWGKYGAPVNVGTYTITFPIAFTTPYNAHVTIIAPGPVGVGVWGQVLTLTTTQLVVATAIPWAVPDASGFYWLAIGV